MTSPNPPAAPVDIAGMTHETFAPLVGQTLVLRADEVTLELLLDNVKLLSEATRRDNHLEIDGQVLPPRRAFALTLEGPREPLLHQGVYEIGFPGLGTHLLFVSPFRQDHDCALYEIAFS